MNRHNAHIPGSSSRQHRRVQQRGHLSRSTLCALVGMAILGLGISQMHKLPEISEKTSKNFVSWTAEQGFTVQNVEVVGRNKVTPQFVMGALQIQRGMPILSYDPRGAQTRLSENPWLQSVNVERRLPDTIFVRIQERTPAARWQVDGKLALVDAEGVALTTEGLEQYQYLPIIIGQEARHQLVDLFDLLRAQPAIGKEVAAATWIGNRRWDLRLKNGIVIRLPALHPETAMAQLAQLDETDKVLTRDILSVDLRLPEKAVLQPTIRANALIERPNFSDQPDLSKKNI